MIAEIDDILIRNFLSFGDYDTLIKLSELRTCLITGEILGASEEPGDDDSNGAGKSTFVNAIIWCLFGRTMHNANPGDKVINWVTKRDCLVRIRFKNGDSLTRTRKGIDGHDEILLIRAGADKSLGTNAMQQKELNRELNQDYVMFCGSTFFSQYGKAWMEMSDPKRREAMEREFRLDRIQLYADYAKDQKQAAEKEQEKLRIKVTSTQHTINTLRGEMSELETASANFDEQKAEQVAEAQARLIELTAIREQLKLPELEILKTKWATITKALSLLAQKELAVEKLDAIRRRLINDIAQQEQVVKKWSNKVGQCRECEQEVSAEYVNSKTSTPQEQLTLLKQQLQETASKLTTERQKIETARNQIESKQPSQTIKDAERDIKEWQRRDQAVKEHGKTIAQMEAMENKYGQSIEKLAAKIAASEATVVGTVEEMKSHDTTILHWNYIYKVYSDRRKIKGRILQEYMPYLNERVNYYLDRFQMKLRIEFTDGMGIRSNYWGYEFFCGGERKRVDVSIMLAMFDLHNLMYGRQCNILVLDEVDGRLDKKGARLLIDIVKNDIASKVDTVLIITHRLDMRGAFESEIRIQKDSPEPEGLSRILEVTT